MRQGSAINSLYMARKNTLTDLSEFLKGKGPKATAGDSIEDFVQEAPHALVDIDTIDVEAEEEQGEEITTTDIAMYIHYLAAERNLSFTDVWLEVINEGTKLDPVLQTLAVTKIEEKGVTRYQFQDKIV